MKKKVTDSSEIDSPHLKSHSQPVQFVPIEEPVIKPESDFG